MTENDHVHLLYIYSFPLSFLPLWLLSSCFFVFLSCCTTPLTPLILPSRSAPPIFTLQYWSHLSSTTWILNPFFPSHSASFFLSPPLMRLSHTHASLSSPHSFRHELITPHLPSLAVSRSLCLALMTSALGSVTVETKGARHRDVTNCMIANVRVCVRLCLRWRSGAVRHRCKQGVGKSPVSSLSYNHFCSHTDTYLHTL